MPMRTNRLRRGMSPLQGRNQPERIVWKKPRKRCEERLIRTVAIEIDLPVDTPAIADYRGRAGSTTSA